MLLSQQVFQSGVRPVTLIRLSVKIGPQWPKLKPSRLRFHSLEGWKMTCFRLKVDFRQRQYTLGLQKCYSSQESTRHDELLFIKVQKLRGPLSSSSVVKGWVRPRVRSQGWFKKPKSVCYHKRKHETWELLSFPLGKGQVIETIIIIHFMKPIISHFKDNIAVMNRN